MTVVGVDVDSGMVKSLNCLNEVLVGNGLGLQVCNHIKRFIYSSLKKGRPAKRYLFRKTMSLSDVKC